MKTDLYAVCMHSLEDYVTGIACKSSVPPNRTYARDQTAM